MPMRFPYLKAARVKLQERKNACLRSVYSSSADYAAQFLSFAKTDPIVGSIVCELITLAQTRSIDVDRYIDIAHHRLTLPHDPDECATLYLRLLERLADPDPKLTIPGFTMIFGRGSNNCQDMHSDFFERTLEPLCSYIDERIDDGDLLLYMLCRYQRECGWFENDTLLSLAQEADSRKLEETLDRHLRKWLFREGTDYPFSTPRSPSGRADIIFWDGEKPLPIEVKVFDGENRDCGNIEQGLWQAHRYAADYSRPSGYLVVFNTSGDLLSFEGDTVGDGPPCVPVGDRTVFGIVVNVSPNKESASKEKAVKTHVVSRPTP